MHDHDGNLETLPKVICINSTIRAHDARSGLTMHDLGSRCTIRAHDARFTIHDPDPVLTIHDHDGNETLINIPNILLKCDGHFPIALTIILYAPRAHEAKLCRNKPLVFLTKVFGYAMGVGLEVTRAFSFPVPRVPRAPNLTLLALASK